MKRVTLIISLISLSIFCRSQNIETSIYDKLQFADETQEYLEGFYRSSGNDGFKYHSLRTDITEGLITRTTDGKMSIEWLTAQVPESADEEKTGFLWLAAQDITGLAHSFDVYFNDKKRFTIQSGLEDRWIVKNPEGGSIRFFGIEKDHHGDSHGYMTMEVPGKWLIPGKHQKIRITGEAAGSNTWLIIFKATDAAEYLQQSLKYDTWLTLEAISKGNKLSVSISGPFNLAGAELNYLASTEKGTVEMNQDGEKATGTFNLSKDNLSKKLSISDSKGDIISITYFGKSGSSSKLSSKTIIQQEQKIDKNGTIIINSTREYKPKMVKSLLHLSESKLSKGRIFLMNSSHQDIAWMDSPEKCMLERDTMLLTPLFEMARHDADYRFDVEDALMLKEYIERHPEKVQLVKKMLSDGRISCGSTFIQPYEEMYSGEALARQFYFGARWLKEKFDYQAKVYWNVDVPGRTLQMPQIMKKAGTDYLMMSRFEKGIYKWYSPDGSFITAFSPGHYADAYRPLQKNFYDAAQFVASGSSDWEIYYDQSQEKNVIPLLSDWDMSPAVDYRPLIESWSSINEINSEDGSTVPIRLPSFQIANGNEFFKSLNKSSTNHKIIRGERPAIWLYIHGPSHQKALKVSREGDIILTKAEKFAAANALIDGSFKNYPQDELNNAWEAKIYPDHGWGGKNGEITDNLFYRKFLYARNEGERILNQTLRDIASKIKTDPEKGKPIIIFNSLNWNRTDVVTTALNFDPGEALGIKLINEDRENIIFQTSDKQTYDDGSLKKIIIHFSAENVPSIGYRTYYYSPSTDKPSSKPAFTTAVENDFYRISFGNGGLTSVYDKESGIELIDTTKFKAGEIFTMRSIGNGAGEFADVQQPDMIGFDKTGNYQSKWSMVEDGPIFTSYKMRSPIRNAEVELLVRLYHQVKRIDFDVDLLNWEGILYREFRFALPLAMKNSKVVYEVPYGVLEVGQDEMDGAAGERYIYPCSETRPRAIQNWIGAYNDDISVYLSSTVTAADYFDPTDNPAPGHILQPILLASRKSCHGEGNDYLQTGDHRFLFSLTSTGPDWRRGYKTALQPNEKLNTVIDPRPYADTVLPESISFFNIDAPNILISTIKKAEADQSVIIRFVEMEGKDSKIKVRSFKSFNDIHPANLIEEPVDSKNAVNGSSISLGHHAIETFRFK